VSKHLLIEKNTSDLKFLIHEAKIKGFKKGVLIDQINIVNSTPSVYKIDGDKFAGILDGTGTRTVELLYLGSLLIYRKGFWAEVVGDNYVEYVKNRLRTNYEQ
jgi:hypothetical protein